MEKLFLRSYCQLINVEGIMKLVNQQRMLKPVVESLMNNIFAQIFTCKGSMKGKTVA